MTVTALFPFAVRSAASFLGLDTLGGHHFSQWQEGVPRGWRVLHSLYNCSLSLDTWVSPSI